MDILNCLQEELQIKLSQIENTITLLDEGNTVPFIARYRKEMTGSLDDQTIRELSERLTYFRNLEEKREQIRATLSEQENLTKELEVQLDNAKTQTELEDIYRPFRPKRRTRASIAKEKGLEPLAELFWEQTFSNTIEEEANAFLSTEIETIAEAIEGAKDILAERISDDADIRKYMRETLLKDGKLITKNTKEESSVYDMYYEYEESCKTLVPHRILAINRGEKDGFLSVKIDGNHDGILERVSLKLVKKESVCRELLEDVIADSYKRLILPSLDREIRNQFTEQAEQSALSVFGENLKQLLLQSPIIGKRVLALDPAFRTGCKIAIIDDTGKPLHTTVLYATANSEAKVQEARKSFIDLVERYEIDLISIGNGTASRESEQFVADALKDVKTQKQVQYLITNEAGASVYSASKLGAEEFPEYDVSLRSAVSIGRRVQDPLAELVKIDPKSIGVGQYQHDMNQKRLSEVLGGVVEDCVNAVGVDLNTASPSLLSYVAGINQTVSKNILLYREEHGKFKNRKELLKVPKLGPKAFLQCAGFLRIPDSETILDRTGIHPESYKATEKLLKRFSYDLNDIATPEMKSLQKKLTDLEEVAQNLEIGVPTLQDILKELEKPARDPRDSAPPQLLRSDVLSMEDLKEDMILTGTVRNVIDFGVFVDIGVHQDGLVHISQICNKFIKHPLEVVKLGDVVSVKILSVDMEKKRIALTMKNI